MPINRRKSTVESKNNTNINMDSMMEDIYNTPSSSTTRHSNRIFEQIQKMNFNIPKYCQDEVQTPKSKKKIKKICSKPENTKDLMPMKEDSIGSIPQKEQNCSTKVLPNSNFVKNPATPQQPSTVEKSYPPSPFEQVKKLQIVSLNMDREEYLKCIAETVTDLNMSLKCFDDGKALQKLLQPWTKAFGIQFNSKTIGDHLNNMAKKLRTEISKIVGKRFFCLKLDIARTNDHSIMVLNIQFIKDFEINVFTLGVLELMDDHFASYLKQQILSTLERYQLDIGNVYSITKDYCSSVKKSLKTLQEFKENDISDDDESDNKDCQIFPEYSQNLSESFVGHALHYVACNIINQLNENISQSRDAVKKLRRKMSELNINLLPVLDNPTRWSSVYDMIKSLLNTRQFVEHNNQLKVEIDWEFARKFDESFKPVIDAITLFQSEHLIMGDLYREWLVCETELEELSDRNELAMILLATMRNQKNILLENETFVAALYLDPRFCFRGSKFLNDKQKKTAIFHLLIIFNKLKTSTENQEEDDETSSCPTVIVYSANERYIKLEKKAAENRDMSNKVKIEPRSSSLTYNENANLSDIDCSWVEESLEQLQYEEKLTFNTNVLYFWKTKSYRNCILSKIAEIALAVPATQVTIKRAFSALPIVLTKHKRNLSTENLESILLLKLNSDLVNKMSL